MSVSNGNGNGSEKKCLIGAGVAVLLILLGGTVLVYRTWLSAEAAQGRNSTTFAAVE